MQKRNFGGRKKGAVNHFTRSVREVMADTFEQMQLQKGVNLLDWAKDNPTEFYKLAAKLIPLQVESQEVTPTTIIQIVPDPLSAPIGTIPV
jgi:hypothetical protein